MLPQAAFEQCVKKTTHMVHNTSIIYFFPWFPSPLIKTRWSGGEPSTVHTKNYTKLRWPSWSDQKTHSSTNKSWPSWEVAAGPGHTVQFIQRRPHRHDQALFHGKRYIYHWWSCQGLHWGSRGDILSHNVVLATFEDNKIQSAELTSENDKFIHILYGVFNSWIYKNI